MKKIGITMRVMPEPNYVEVRDALAQSWTDYMKFAFSDCRWMALPNAGSSVIDIVKGWELDAFIFSGGGDVGQDPLRDLTEKTILEYAMERRLPVFGVCRGMQFLQHYFGGALSPLNRAVHVGKHHSIYLSDDLVDKISEGPCVTVNSYHGIGIKEEELSDAMLPVAVTGDGWVEAFKHKSLPIMGIIWHPERDEPFRAVDTKIIRSLFGLPFTPSGKR